MSKYRYNLKPSPVECERCEAKPGELCKPIDGPNGYDQELCMGTIHQSRIWDERRLSDRPPTCMRPGGPGIKVAWSEDDKEWVGTCKEFPSLSHVAPTEQEALDGIKELIKAVRQDIDERGR